MNRIPDVIVEIKPSMIVNGEVGVFAAKNIDKDSVVFNADHYDDMEFHAWDEYDRLNKNTQEKIKDYCPGREEGFYAPKDFNYLSIAWHMNHSCSPNIGFNESDDFVAMKDIKHGEELSWDYGFDESNPNFKLYCLCGAKNCRETITGNDWKKLCKDTKINQYLSTHAKELCEKL